MALPFGIQPSTLAGGISGLLTWGLGLGLTAAGIAVPPTAIAPAALLIATAFVHFVPDAATVDKDLKVVGTILANTQTFDVYPVDGQKNSLEAPNSTKS